MGVIKTKGHCYSTRPVLKHSQVEVGQHIVVHRVGKVIKQVLEGADAGEDSLDEVAKARKHGQPSVLNLLGLKDLQLSSILAETGKVEEGTTGVSGIARASQEVLQAEEGGLGTISRA